MRIILSPTKKMKQDSDFIAYENLPKFIDETQKILSFLKELSFDEKKALWSCNEKIALQNNERIEKMDLFKNLTPAVLAYEGLAFQYMAPTVFEDKHFEYVQKHLRILSAFYGVLKPLDGVRSYRLEMQAKASIENHKDLYDFWGDKLYNEVIDESRIIINLASKEYYKCIENYLKPEDTFITCIFGETVKGKIVQKGTFAKMARGEMVRFLAENQIEDPEGMKAFDRLNFKFRDDLSDKTTYVFERKPQ